MKLKDELMCDMNDLKQSMDSIVENLYFEYKKYKSLSENFAKTIKIQGDEIMNLKNRLERK